MQFLKDRQRKPFYRAGTLRRSPTRRHVRCLKAWKSWSKYTKEEQLLKIPPGKKPTVPVMAGSLRNEKPPSLASPIRDALVSARKICRPSDQWVNRRKNMLGAWPQALY